MLTSLDSTHGSKVTYISYWLCQTGSVLPAAAVGIDCSLAVMVDRCFFFFKRCHCANVTGRVWGFVLNIIFNPRVMLLLLQIKNSLQFGIQSNCHHVELSPANIQSDVSEQARQRAWQSGRTKIMGFWTGGEIRPRSLVPGLGTALTVIDHLTSNNMFGSQNRWERLSSDSL